MAMRLQRGQKTDLTQTNAGLKRIRVSIGWDAKDFDPDASVFLLNANDKVSREADFVCYTNPKGGDGAVVHLGNNVIGKGHGQQFWIDLTRIPAKVEKVVFAVTTHEADMPRQNFGQRSNTFIRIADDKTGTELVRYDVDAGLNRETAVVLGALYRYKGAWKFHAIGGGFSGGLATLCHNFGLEVEETPIPPEADAPIATHITKGAKVELTQTYPGLTKIRVGLGWDAKKHSGAHSLDLDTSAFLLGPDNKAANERALVFRSNRRGGNESVVHVENHQSGKDPDDREQFQIAFKKVPPDIEKIAFAITIREAYARKQDFGLVSNPFIRIVNDETDTELLRYELGRNSGSRETVVIVGELYRHAEEWKFNAIGSGFSGGLMALCRHFGLQVSEASTPESVRADPPSQRRASPSTNVAFVASRDLESIELIEDYIEMYIGGVGRTAHIYRSSQVHIDLNIIEPTPTQKFYTLVTAGMSDLPMLMPGKSVSSGSRCTELLICLPPDWQMSEAALKKVENAWPLRLIKTLAQYPRQRNISLGMDDIVANSDPPMQYAWNTQFCGALLYIPTLFDPEFIELKVREEKTILFLSVLPIYKTEMDFASEHGSQALLELLAGDGVTELLNVNRENVCKQ